jgi:hypothetical protein
MANAGMIITIEEPESGIWRGTAKLGSRNLMWRYEARSGWLKILEQDTRNPQCWNFIVPPRRARKQVYGVVERAIRRLDVGGPYEARAGCTGSTTDGRLTGYQKPWFSNHRAAPLRAGRPDSEGLVRSASSFPL